METIKKYCSKCGRRLIDNAFCSVHLDNMDKVNGNAEIVKEFKKLEKYNMGD